MRTFSRRSFLAIGPGAALAASAAAGAAANNPTEIPATFPATISDRAREIVGASHARIDRVRELLAEDAGLAKAAWDWGYGDWESAIGAASHTGQKEIIELLLAHGARPTLFTLATLDQVDAVRAVLEHVPGAAALEGPHSISLYDHAWAGEAERVMEYLEAAGRHPPDPFTIAQADAEPYLGVYAWGTGEKDRFTVEWIQRRSRISLTRAGHFPINMIPLGGHRFSPAGARHVTIRFELADGRASRVTVPWSGVTVTAGRI